MEHRPDPEPENTDIGGNYMEIQVEKLRQTLDLVVAAIPRGKVKLPITTSVLFSDGKVMATNLEYWISVNLPELGDLSFLLPYRALTEALKFTPGRETITLSPEEGRVVLATSGSRLTLVKPGQPHDFPPMPQPAGDGFVVDGDRLVHGFLEVLPYVSTESARPVLTAVALKLGDELQMATADGFRLAIYQPGIPLRGTDTGHIALVPGKAAQVLGGLWRKGDKPPDIDAAAIVGETTNGGPEQGRRGGSVHIGRLAVAKRNLRLVEDGNHIRFSFGSISLCSHLIQGEFPNYTHLVPVTEGGRRVMVHAEELLRAVNQVAEIASEGSNIARLRWSAGQLVISARAADIGEAEVSIRAVVEGEDGEIAFNLRNLQQYLRGKTDIVTIATVPGDDAQVRGTPGV